MADAPVFWHVDVVLAMRHIEEDPHGCDASFQRSFAGRLFHSLDAFREYVGMTSKIRESFRVVHLAIAANHDRMPLCS
jgi:hypothetical protein